MKILLILSLLIFFDTCRGPTSDDSLDRIIENLSAFAKVYGHVKYFHPSDEAREIDWDKLAVHGVNQIKNVQNERELREVLEMLFSPIAPTVTIHDSKPDENHFLSTYLETINTDTSGLKTITWQHKGVYLGTDRQPYRSSRTYRTDFNLTRGSAIYQYLDAKVLSGKEIRFSSSVRSGLHNPESKAELIVVTENENVFSQEIKLDENSSEWGYHELLADIEENTGTLVAGFQVQSDTDLYIDNLKLEYRSGSSEWKTYSLNNPDFTLETPEGPADWEVNSVGIFEYGSNSDPSESRNKTFRITSKPKIFDQSPSVGETAVQQISEQLWSEVPLALYGTEEFTLPQTNISALQEQRFTFYKNQIEQIDLNNTSTDDENLRLANIIIAWNVFQHFYPYFDVVDVDWDQVLTTTLRRALQDQTDDEFLETLQWMVAQLEDGHGRVQHPSMREFAGLPFLVDSVENKIIIVAVADNIKENACFERGDLVISIDGILSEEVIRDSKKYISGSSQWKTYLALRSFGRGQRGTEAILELERQGDIVMCQVSRNQNGSIEEKRPDPVELLHEGIYYVDLSRASMNDINTKLNVLAAADGIVFDLRGYPNSNHGILQHLSKDTLRSAHWQVPLQIYPDQMELVGYDTSGRWLLEPMEPYFRGKIVFLTDGRAISYAESIMGIVEHYHLGEIVGQPTAGANGNVNFFTLPDGYRISWTGMRVIKHDNSQHHLIGIKPTVPLDQTLEGVLADRDEYLESALELIEESLNP